MAQVQVRQQFQAGEKVSLHQRVGDWFSTSGAGDAVKTEKADDEGVVTFSGLNAGDPFWAVGEEGRQMKVVAKDSPAGKSSATSVPPELAAQTRSESSTSGTVTSGPRDSRSGKVEKSPESPAPGHQTGDRPKQGEGSVTEADQDRDPSGASDTQDSQTETAPKPDSDGDPPAEAPKSDNPEAAKARPKSIGGNK